jgi:hypothetical protein
MADVSSITGYGIHSAFSNYGGYAGASSTTSGVGGVGEYHHHHLNQASEPQNAAGPSSPPINQSSDLLEILGSTNQTGGNSAASIASGTGLGLLTGDSSSTLAAWLAGAGSPGNPSGGPGQIIDTLA